MNVLSLFDGISCGRIALDKININVENYYSSEINENAILVADNNYPQDKQNRLGDIQNWRDWDIDFSSIDLVLAGSPCQGFSFAGTRLNFADSRSKLYFVFLDILRHIQKLNPKVLFLLENVVMKSESQNIISENLNVQPIKINSSLVSAQLRKRLYWTNINNVKQPSDRNISLSSVLQSGITDKNKAYCLTLHRGNLRDYFKKAQTTVVYEPCEQGLYSVDNGYISMFFKKGKEPDRLFTFRTKVPTGRYNFRPLSSTECETLQNVPKGYTNYVSEAQRCMLLGNGWTVDVIAHILQGIKEMGV